MQAQFSTLKDSILKSKSNIFKIAIIAFIASIVISIISIDAYNCYASSKSQVVDEFMGNFDEVLSVAQDLNTMLEKTTFSPNTSDLNKLESTLSETDENLEKLKDNKIESSRDALLDYSKALSEVITQSEEYADNKNSSKASSEFSKLKNSVEEANDQVEVLEDAIRSEMRLDIDLDNLDVSGLYLTTPKESKTSTKTSSSQESQKKSEEESKNTQSQQDNNNQSSGETQPGTSQSNGNQSGNQSNEGSQSQQQQPQTTPATGQAQEVQTQQPVTTTTTVTTYTTYVTEETTTTTYEEVIEEVEEVENVEVVEEVQAPQVQETIEEVSEPQAQESIEDNLEPQVKESNEVSSQHVPTIVEGNIAYGNLILNKRNNKLHKYPGCRGVELMRNYNKQVLQGPINLDDYENLCKICFADEVKLRSK